MLRRFVTREKVILVRGSVHVYRIVVYTGFEMRKCLYDNTCMCMRNDRELTSSEIIYSTSGWEGFCFASRNYGESINQ